MTALLASFGAAVVTGVILTALFYRLGNTFPEVTTDDRFRVSTNKSVVWLVVIVGTVMFIGSAYLTFMTDTGGLPIVFAAFGALMILSIAPSLTSRHDLLWDDQTLEGPCQAYLMTLGPQRGRMDFADIVRTGKTSGGYWYVEDGAGQRIYWSFLHKGHLYFKAALQTQCTDIELPEDL